MRNSLFVLLLVSGCDNRNINYYEIKKRVETYQNSLINNQITGSSTSRLYHNGKIQFTSIVNSKVEGDMEINNETIFPIWSMSKPITIVAMMILFEEEKFNLDDKVSNYIPSFSNLKCKSNDEIYDCNNELKIIHLLTHTSGFKYYDSGVGDISHADTAFSSLDDWVNALVLNQHIEFEPGTNYHYGINQAILGRLIEVLSEKSFYELLKDRIFDPLEMKNTKFYLTDDERSRFQPLYLKNWNGDQKSFTKQNDELQYNEYSKMYFGGEGLVSTMDDYSNFCQMLTNNGIFKGEKIIDYSSIELMSKPYTKNRIESGYYSGFDIGYSFFNLQEPLLDGTNSSKGIYGWSGYHNTHFWIDPQKNLFCLFMTRTIPYSNEIQRNLRSAIYSYIN